MPTPGQVARAHYRKQQALAKQAALAAAAVWAAVQYADLDASWSAVAVRAENLLAAGQYAAAAQATEYLLAQVAAQDVVSSATYVNAGAFAGRAADGRALSTLLQQGVIDVKVAIAAGMSRQDSMLRGLGSLTTIFVNETAQAGRNADQVGITGQRAMTGYTRMLRPPSCSRCIILAGKFYRWNTGFARHPHCDCIHIPAAESSGVKDTRTNPRATFDSMTKAEQDQTFGMANAQAIRDGADLGQVVNARRGMASFDSSTTIEGANVQRGRYGNQMATTTGQLDPRQRAQNGRHGGYNPLAPKSKRYAGVGQFELADVARLTPRAIYDLAGDDRDLAVMLLRRYGYLS